MCGYGVVPVTVASTLGHGMYKLYKLNRSLVTAPCHPSDRRATRLVHDVGVGDRVRDQGVGVCGGGPAAWVIARLPKQYYAVPYF